jgi:hypothetical protein
MLGLCRFPQSSTIFTFATPFPKLLKHVMDTLAASAQMKVGRASNSLSIRRTQIILT